MFKKCKRCEYFMDNGAFCCSLTHKSVTENKSCSYFTRKGLGISMSKLLIFYLSIREPVLYLSLLIFLVGTSIVSTVAFCIWLFCIIVSKYAVDRYFRYKKEYEIK